MAKLRTRNWLHFLLTRSCHRIQECVCSTVEIEKVQIRASYSALYLRPERVYNATDPVRALLRCSRPGTLGRLLQDVHRITELKLRHVDKH